MDANQYLEIFIIEMKEGLETLSCQLPILKKDPENKDAAGEIFRVLHSFVGMSSVVGYKRIYRLTRAMKEVFFGVWDGRVEEIKMKTSIVDIVFQCLDALEAYLMNIMKFQDEGTEDNEPIIAKLNTVLKKILVKEKVGVQ